MAEFSYKAINSQGLTEEGVKTASDQQALLKELQSQGYIPIKIEPAKAHSFLGIQLGGGTRLKQKEVLLLTGELATLLDSGLPLDRSLQVLIQLTEDNPTLSRLIVDVLEKVKGGSSLADALESQSGVFSRFYLNMIRAGELGGNMADVLNRLAEYMDSAQELKDTVSTALIYPAVLLIMSLASIFVMLIFVVPQFTEMFENSGQELPFATQIVVGLAEFLQSYWWVILTVVMGLVSYMKSQLADPERKKVWDARFLKAPLFGEIVLHKEVAGLSRTLGTLLGNGVSILKALGIVRETAGNSVIKNILEQSEEHLKQGGAMSDALLDSDAFPKLAVQMVKMGEETGKLEEMLLRIANIYDKQLKTSIQRMLALLEPALIISLGLIIAGIIISILLAILSVNDLAF